MPNWLSKSLYALVVAGVIMAPSASFAEVRKGDRAAKLTGVVDGRGKSVSLKKYRNEVVVLTFGASWCAPCKKELPALEKLAQAYDKKRAKVRFFAVNIDSEKSKGRAFMKSLGLGCVVALYDLQQATAETYDPPKMPSTYIIRKGVVRHLHDGYNSGDEKKIRRHIDAELAKL